MTIEQRPELNRYVDASIPLTWEYRWRQIKIVLPSWVFICVVLIESALFRAWLSNRLSPGFYLAIFATCLFILFVLCGGIELQVRVRQGSKRTIRFAEKRIIIQPAKTKFVRWEKITKFQFVPVTDAPNLAKLNVFSKGRSVSQSPTQSFWAMVLEDSQKQELLRYLQTKRTEASTSCEIELSERPIRPEPQIPYPLLGASLYLSGILCMLHGSSCLLVALGRAHHDSGGNSKFTPEEIAKLGQFLAQHFSSMEELQHFCLKLGLALFAVGIVLSISGWRLMKRRRQVTPLPGGA